MKAHSGILLPAMVLALSCTTLAQGNDGYARRTLFGLPGVHVVVELSLPPGMTSSVTDAELEVEAERALKRAGINIVSREKLNAMPGRPRLYFGVRVRKPDDKQVSALSVETMISQKVHLDRDNSITADAVTWSVYTLGVIEYSDVKQAAKAAIGRATDEFIAAFREQNPKK